MTTSIDENYQSLANDAALLEQKGLYPQAKVYWQLAADVADNKQNREWANNRAHTCEKRGG